MAPPAVELRQVSKSYREGEAERVVLRDVSVTLARGEIVVLVGRSGSGKSTLLNVIAGIDRPSLGTVVVDGTDLTALDEQARTRFRRRHIGFVFQFYNLIPLLTVEENLLLPLDLNNRADAKGIARARELLERVGLGGRGDSYPERLSGGEQQRVAIARALIHDPALILADEPTGNLDAETAAAALDLLDTLPRPAMLARLAARQLRSHPWQLGLAILGIALGVAVAVSIDLANGSALRAFALATEAVSGRATHQILGGPSGLPDDLYRRLRVDVGVRRAAPIVEGDVVVADRVVDVAAADRAGDTPRAGRVGRNLHLLGIDPFVDSHFRPYLAAEDRGEARGRDALSRAADLVGRAGTALIAASTARDLSLAIGRELALEVSGHRRTLTIVGLLQPVDPASARALDGLLVTDIATAQETLGAVGRLTRIDLIVGDDAPGRALLARVAQALPAGADLVSAGATAGATARMIMAFQWNLTALSLLALVVGMFLIYQTMTFSVVQRRPLIGSLRALGVTRGEIFALVMSEALVIGIAGTLLGVGLGFGMAQGLLRLVTRTINDLYFVLSVREGALDPVTLAKSVLLGIGATALAALPPALEATAAPPRIVMSRDSLESSARRRAHRAGWLGLVALAAGAVILAVPGSIVVGFAGLLVLMVGCALVTPAAALGLLSPLHRVAGAAFGLLGRLATRSIVAALSRTSVAMARSE